MTTHTDDFEGGPLGPEWKSVMDSTYTIQNPAGELLPQWAAALAKKGDLVRWEKSSGYPDRYWINEVEVFEPQPNADGAQHD